MSHLLTKGTPLLYWPGIRVDAIPGKHAVIISDGVTKFCGTDCVRIQKPDGGTDYIALTHIQVLESTPDQ